jgi:hypothetical protein
MPPYILLPSRIYTRPKRLGNKLSPEADAKHGFAGTDRIHYRALLHREKGVSVRLIHVHGTAEDYEPRRPIEAREIIPTFIKVYVFVWYTLCTERARKRSKVLVGYVAEY